ncbi:hypothetical protein [Chromobacterium sphagni]|uniref:Uncharacterized protein n=1 Tax=Chromobacterium sphagni TaxID=1903179 RepID=A0A1S1X3Z4_9NEIS|nr:hypothetical protein [Chromobacterium sphagni]OHX14207.1 hypothetical protein BI347_12355 [Chromobacterium sphagni]OHX20454.1 hypothetical protein BI344_08275 [Chromobacterium sphagni]
MSLYAELVKKAADQYRTQLDAIYAQQKTIQRADHIAGQLFKAGLKACAQADGDYRPYILLQLTDELQPLKKTVLLYICNVLECAVEPPAPPTADNHYQLLPSENEPGQPRLLLVVEAA